MSTPPTARLAELGLSLPEVPAPLAAYVPAARTGGLAFSAGQLPFVSGQLLAVGKVGSKVPVETAVQCARVAALNGLAAVAAEVGGLDAIARVVKVVVYVAGGPAFVEQPRVANGASQLLGDVFGDAGRHARSAVGVTSLPMDSPVEVELIVEVRARATVQPVATSA
ncbi:MAG TPA: RidA family protein [Propionibacteriaceae bacterium]